jgi:demethoxyubiquinone hydroxylase (CLK1/Coq7/Cat5 family)
MQTNTTPKTETHTQNASVEKLQDLLRSELSAVETYEMALKSVSHVGLHRTLQEILVSHSRRIPQLREKITGMGSEPLTSSGVWGAFAQAFQVGADILGDRVAIAALEAGEDRALELYSGDMEGVDARTRKFIDSDLSAEQRRTHDLCRTLKSYASAPS